MKNSKKGQNSNVFSFMKKAFLEGDLKTRLSFLILGFGNILHKQIVKGILFLAIEIDIPYLYGAVWCSMVQVPLETCGPWEKHSRDGYTMRHWGLMYSRMEITLC